MPALIDAEANLCLNLHNILHYSMSTKKDDVSNVQNESDYWMIDSWHSFFQTDMRNEKIYYYFKWN